ncbi:MAG: ABC transporter ATP-binding protein [Candidatus Saccharibacteria bacterium]|nr:ABC transporter ATP-binding protein [Pseudorhodobacter sp.]
MIELQNITKAYYYKGRPKYIARNVSAMFPTGARIGLMGRNGAGKSTLLSIIAGSLNADTGRVRITGSMSWPIGLQGCVHPDLTGTQNVKFIARVYGVDTDELIDFVSDFAELGQNFDQPVRNYSSGMKARLQFGMSMGIRFDTYLIDEVSAVGDAGFKKKSKMLFDDRMSQGGVVMVTHSEGMMRSMCTSGAVLEGGQLTMFDTVDEALERHNRNTLGEDYKRSKEFMED